MEVSMELNDQEVGFRQARVAANRRKLVVCLACSFAAACLVAAFGDQTRYRASLALRMQLDDDVSESTASKMFGEGMNSLNGGATAAFEPNTDADVGILGDTNLDERMRRYKAKVDANETGIVDYVDTANKKLDMPGVVSFP